MGETGSCRMKRKTIAFRLAILVAVWGALGVASAMAEAIVDKPVYFPHTKSYFELAKAKKGQSVRGSEAPEIQWGRAQALAESRRFKGATGRLAIVKDAETQAFLMKTFRPERPSIIGLRYYCAYNRMLWANGEEHPREGFSNWGSPWRVGYACQGPNSVAVVFIEPAKNGQWLAHDQQKEFYTYFVEFPTGGP